MSEINKRFVLYKTRADFDTQLQTGGVSQKMQQYLLKMKNLYIPMENFILNLTTFGL